ncbi:hypothetical protein JRO89_XS10G0028900 [Xanthoceras sorbifolium]|uniref:Bulb-type lectin domain-containing protein n=1 Tax=Xanthoceras sorbifolium TaxID=99658 RepID=A0ABQ8HHC1_9ROSI|nr:hypothetical protein JRO89_XS10G0028900 [Xanthoceras sorbifolium]
MAFPLLHVLCILLLLLLPHFTAAQPYKNISLGESLTAGNGDSSWNSPSGEFAFGFQQIEKEIFLLAIYFNKIPEKTIVWSAKTKNPMQRGSKVQLTGDGWLKLTDPAGNQIWKPDTAGAAAAYGAMLDTGNFVLAGQDSAPLWESFDHPTDTILPTQILKRGSKLTARYSDKSYTSGRFELSLQSNGNLALYTVAFPLESTNSDYWSTKIAGSGFQLIFNQSGNIYLTARNGSMIYMLSLDAASEQDFYQRAILEYDGVFRHYVYPKNTSSSIERWGMHWSTLSFTPPNICTITGATGSGACGFNSYCRLGDDQRPICQCPQGYTSLDPNDLKKGCKQNFVSQNCDDPSLEVDLFYLAEMPNTDWPISDYEHYQGVNEDWCRQACLGDCFCAVAIFRKGECWKKKNPLSNGRIDPSVGGVALIKIRKDDSTLRPEDKDAEKKNHLTLVIVGSLLLSSSVFLNILLLGGTFLLVFCFGYNIRKMHHMYPVMPGMNLQSFTYYELEKATNGFKEELGRGAFATVYKGILAFENRKLVAVKKLYNMVREEDKEFRTEVSAIGQTNHKNLVKLLGFCNEEKHRLLNFEPNVEDENQMVLADWAYDCYKDKTLHLLVENDEEALHDMERVKKCVIIAIWCIQEDPSLRPTMKKVTQMLEEVVEVSTPPDPSSFVKTYMALVFLYPLLVLMLQLLPISTAVQVYGNITLGSSLTASKHKYGPSWKSPSGEFAFGFQKIGRHGFLLAIWFDKIPQKTVVWSANRDQLVPEGSKVELTRDGQLILRDQKGRQQWSAELSGTGVAHASMLDTGNFVLASHDSTNLWESFDNPTDTVLPTQTINQGSKLVASISATNYSSGRFMFTLQTDGNAAMYTTDYPLGTPNFAYWSTQTSVNGGSQLHFNQSGYMYLELDNGSIAEEIISNLVSGIYYQRVILDYDGVLKQSIYPKYFASTVRRWSTLSNLPSNICTAIEEQIGSGACGFNSFCSLEHDQRKKCHCPPGYSFLDPDDVMKGCKQDFVPHSCDKASEEMDLFEFREMRYTDWPKSDYEHFGGVSEDYCKRACLSDCFCSVIVYNNEECWKKKLPLVNGRNDPSIGGKTMIKVRKANSSISRCSDPKKKQIILSALLETLQLLVENDEEALHDMNRLKKYVMIAIWCIQEDPLSRPTMKKVTQMLEGVVEVSTPLDFS